VDTSAVVAGFGGGHTVGRPPVRRTAMPAAFKYALAVSRRTPVVPSMRRSDHPRRPSARTCCRLDSLKTLLMSGEGPSRPRRSQRLGLAIAGGRFSGVHQWPVLGVHRGAARAERICIGAEIAFISRLPGSEAALRALQRMQVQMTPSYFETDKANRDS